MSASVVEPLGPTAFAAPAVAPPAPPPVATAAPTYSSPPTPLVPPARTKSSKGLYIGLGVGALAIAGIAVGLVLKGGDGGASSKEDLVKQTMAALSAGDADKLAALGDVEVMADRFLDCSSVGGAAYGSKRAIDKQQRRQRADVARAIELANKASIEVVSIGESAAPDQLEKGREASEGCVTTMPLKMHRIEVVVRVKQGTGEPREGTVKMRAIEGDGGWYLVKLPDLEDLAMPTTSARDTIAKMRMFKNRMCNCFDKTCADAVQEQLVKWSAEIAGDDRSKLSDNDAAEMGSLSQDYTSCMIKLLDASHAVVAAPPTPEADEPDQAQGASVFDAIPECKRYGAQMEKLANCDKMPAASRDALAKAFKDMQKSFSSMRTIPTEARSAMANGCKQAADALAQAAAAMCP